MRKDTLGSFPVHHDVCYEIVRYRGRLTCRQFHQRYDAVGDAVYDGRDQTPICKRERRPKLQILVDDGLRGLEGDGLRGESWPQDASIVSQKEDFVGPGP